MIIASPAREESQAREASPARNVSQVREASKANEASQAREVIQVVWTADMKTETRNFYNDHL